MHENERIFVFFLPSNTNKKEKFENVIILHHGECNFPTMKGSIQHEVIKIAPTAVTSLIEENGGGVVMR